jgi:hypothetical protein
MAEAALAIVLGLHYGGYIPDAIMVVSFAKCVERRVHNHVSNISLGPLRGDMPFPDVYPSCTWMAVWRMSDAVAVASVSHHTYSHACICLPPLDQMRWCCGPLPWLPRLEGWRLFGEELTTMLVHHDWPEDLSGYLGQLDDQFEDIENQIYRVSTRSRMLRRRALRNAPPFPLALIE